jgi:DNA-binding transcriptional ArsR family regulator
LQETFPERDSGSRDLSGKDPVLETMVDVTSLLILSATANERKTVRDLAVELNLPIASLYRKVRALQAAGVLSAEKVKDRGTGKETMTYESLLSGLNIRFGAPDTHVELSFRDDGTPVL